MQVRARLDRRCHHTLLSNDHSYHRIGTRTTLHAVFQNPSTAVVGLKIVSRTGLGCYDIIGPAADVYMMPTQIKQTTSQLATLIMLKRNMVLVSYSNSSSASENEVKDVKASSLFSGTKDADIAGADLDHKIGIDDSVENRSDAEQVSQQKGNSVESDSQKDDDGESEKLYRAAVLKNRFADTILKAREKTLHQDEKADPREKEQLENQKRKGSLIRRASSR